MSLVPVSGEQQANTTCANCNAPLLADQRYCLSCGRPASPVRLAFLDVLTPPAPPPAAGATPGAWAPAGFELTPSGYVPMQQQGAAGWLRRNSALMGLLTVLALFLLAGLLVGHWVSQSKTPANQTFKIEGLAGLGAAGASNAGGASTTPSGESAAPASKGSAGESKKDEEAGKHETAKEKAPPPAPKKVAPTQIKKLTQSTGKKHQEEINALGAQPIETG
jgi:hypothetical protein